MGAIDVMVTIVAVVAMVTVVALVGNLLVRRFVNRKSRLKDLALGSFIVICSHAS